MIFVARFASLAALALAGLAPVGAPATAAEMIVPAVHVVKSSTPTEVPAAPAATLVPATIPTPSALPAAQDEAAEEFASLDAAVAAQDRAVADEATRCLAGAIYFESQGEPLSGQLAVAKVIINRAKSGRFPADVCGVVTQRGQFGFVRGGRIPSIDQARAAYRTAVAVARVALADAWDGVADDALYFNTPGRAPAARLRRVAMIGNHVFYR